MNARIQRNGEPAAEHEGLVQPHVRTARLYLRGWRPADATLLLPVLEANAAHLATWIPAHVAAPVPLSDLEQRLAGFADDFRQARSWRYGIFSTDERTIFGEVSLFPRSQVGRVSFASADRLEIGYWLRSDVTGRGYATEACGAMLRVAQGLPGIRHVEIRCDPRNEPSAAVPRRLGFRPGDSTSATHTADPAGSERMIWTHELAPFAPETL